MYTEQGLCLFSLRLYMQPAVCSASGCCAPCTYLPVVRCEIACLARDPLVHYAAAGKHLLGLADRQTGDD